MIKLDNSKETVKWTSLMVNCCGQIIGFRGQVFFGYRCMPFPQETMRWKKRFYAGTFFVVVCTTIVFGMPNITIKPGFTALSITCHRMTSCWAARNPFSLIGIANLNLLVNSGGANTAGILTRRRDLC